TGRDVALMSKLVTLLAGVAADPAKIGVLFLGDSVSERVSRDERKAEPLVTMFAKNLRESAGVQAVTHSGLHAEVFLAILRATQALGGKPRVLVMPINLRSFSPQWWYAPEYQFA